jgi:CRP-like cAMP-binding protein
MTGLPFITYLSSLVQLNHDLTQELYHLLIPEIYHNRQIFHGAGQVENRLWFLEEGLVRSYYFDAAGKEHTLQFFNRGEVIFSVEGLYQERSDLYLEALEPVRVVSLSYPELFILYNRYSEVRHIARIIVRRRYQADHFYLRLMNLVAEERYRQFRKVSPEIFRRVSVKTIATHLNMTRENLSKLITHDNK